MLPYAVHHGLARHESLAFELYVLGDHHDFVMCHITELPAKALNSITKGPLVKVNQVVHWQPHVVQDAVFPERHT